MLSHRCLPDNEILVDTIYSNERKSGNKQFIIFVFRVMGNKQCRARGIRNGRCRQAILARRVDVRKLAFVKLLLRSRRNHFLPIAV